MSIFSAIEFCLWDAWDDMTNFQRNLSTGQVEVEDGVIYHKTEYRERRDHFAYFACSENRRRVRHAARRFPWAVPRMGSPLAVEHGEAGNSAAHGWAPLAHTMSGYRWRPAKHAR